MRRLNQFAQRLYLPCRVEDDGFARTCFTREDDQAGVKTQIEFIYNGKILDMKFSEHRLLSKDQT